MWLDRRSRKLRIKKENALLGGGALGIDGGIKHTKKSRSPIFDAPAPENFSIVNNPEETIEYFNKIMSEIKQRKFHEAFKLDFDKVEKVTIDAIAYSIAILRNIKSSSFFHYEFSGKFPENTEAKKAFIESGFLNYVEAKKLKIPKSNKKMQIVTSEKVDTDVAKGVCDFVNNFFSTAKKNTRTLYNTIIELMSNTVQHAYSSRGSHLMPCWFLFAEFEDEHIEFTFVDIGEGIPSTINKKIIKDILLSDGKAILSALNGEFRSETKTASRGRGLPYLKESTLENKFSDFAIISGSGCCAFSKEKKDFELSAYNSKLFGTIFRWRIERSNLDNEEQY